MTSSEELIADDLVGITQAKLSRKNSQLKEVKSSVKREFLIPRWFGSISLSEETESKGYKTSDVWIRKIEIHGLNESQVETVRSLIEEQEWQVSMNEMKSESGSWRVEVM